MDSLSYLAFIEEMNFGKNIPFTYSNDLSLQYPGLVGILHGFTMNLQNEFIFKKRKCYRLYIHLQHVYRSGSELSYKSYLNRYIEFFHKDIRIYYSTFIIRFNCTPASSEEIFLSTLVPHSESHWDSSDFLDFIRDVINFDFSFEYALNKLLMLTNPSLVELCNINIQKYQMVRKHIKLNLFK